MRLRIEQGRGEVPIFRALALEIETPEGRDLWYRAFENVGLGELETSEQICFRFEREGAQPKCKTIFGKIIKNL